MPAIWALADTQLHGERRGSCTTHLFAVRRQRQEGLTEAQVTVGRAGSNLLGLWPVHFCGNSWAESKTEVGWASPELRATVGAGTPALFQKNVMG